MATHTVSLPEELDSFVAASVANGDYPDASAVLLDALRVLEREKREDEAKMKTLIAEIQEGEDSGVFEGDAFESVRRQMGWTAEL
jgi:putative addiction module CopG family antidote